MYFLVASGFSVVTDSPLSCARTVLTLAPHRGPFGDFLKIIPFISLVDHVVNTFLRDGVKRVSLGSATGG